MAPPLRPLHILSPLLLLLLLLLLAPTGSDGKRWHRPKPPGRSSSSSSTPPEGSEAAAAAHNRRTPKKAWKSLIRSLESVVNRRAAGGEYSGEKQHILDSAKATATALLTKERDAKYTPSSQPDAAPPSDAAKALKEEIAKTLRQLEDIKGLLGGGVNFKFQTLDADGSLASLGGSDKLPSGSLEDAIGSLGSDSTMDALTKLLSQSGGGGNGQFGLKVQIGGETIDLADIPKGAGGGVHQSKGDTPSQQGGESGWQPAPEIPEDEVDEAGEVDAEGYYEDPYKKRDGGGGSGGGRRGTRKKWRQAEKEEDRKVEEEERLKKKEGESGSDSAGGWKGGRKGVKRKTQRNATAEGDYDYDGDDDATPISQVGRDTALSKQFNKPKSDSKLRRGMSHLFDEKDSISFTWGVPWGSAKSGFGKKRWDYMEDRVFYTEDFPMLRRMFEGHALGFFDPQEHTKDESRRKARSAVRNLVEKIKTRGSDEVKKPGDPKHTQLPDPFDNPEPPLPVSAHLMRRGRFYAFFQGHRLPDPDTPTQGSAPPPHAAAPCGSASPSGSPEGQQEGGEENAPTCSSKPPAALLGAQEEEGRNATAAPPPVYRGQVASADFLYTGFLSEGSRNSSGATPPPHHPAWESPRHFPFLGPWWGSGVAPEGRGVLQAGGVTYTGDFSRGLPHGHGELAWGVPPQRCGYRGGFSWGHLHGSGVLRCGTAPPRDTQSHTEVYSGGFALGKFDGFGTLRSRGCILKGNFTGGSITPPATAGFACGGGVAPRQPRAILNGTYHITSPGFTGDVSPLFSLHPVPPLLRFPGEGIPDGVGPPNLRDVLRPTGSCAVSLPHLRYAGACEGLEMSGGLGTAHITPSATSDPAGVEGLEVSGVFHNGSLRLGRASGVMHGCAFSVKAKPLDLLAVSRDLLTSPEPSSAPSGGIWKRSPSLSSWPSKGTLDCTARCASPENCPFLSYQGGLKGGLPSGQGSMLHSVDSSIRLLLGVIAEAGGGGGAEDQVEEGERAFPEVSAVDMVGAFRGGVPHGQVAVVPRGVAGADAKVLGGRVLRVMFRHGRASGWGTVSTEGGEAVSKVRFSGGVVLEHEMLQASRGVSWIPVALWYTTTFLDILLFHVMVDDNGQINVLAIVTVGVILGFYIMDYLRRRGRDL